MAKDSHLPAAFIEGNCLGTFNGHLPTHSFQKGGRAKGGISPAGRSSLEEEEQEEEEEERKGVGVTSPVWKEECQGGGAHRRETNIWQSNL